MTRLQKSLLLFAIAMGLFTLARLALYLRYPEFFAPLDAGEIAAAFLAGLRFDGAILARFAGIPLLLLALPFAWLERPLWTALWGWLAYGVVLAAGLLLVGDILYFGEVNRHVSYELLLLQDDWGFLFGYAWRVYGWALPLLLATAIGLGWLWQRILTRPPTAMRLGALQYLVFVLAVLVVGRGSFDVRALGIVDAYREGEPAYGHLSLNGVFSAALFALKLEQANHHFYPHEEAVAILAQERTVADAAYPMVQRHGAATPSGRNLIFLLLESWSVDHLGSYHGPDGEVSPHFDALAADGRKFTRCFAAGQRSVEGVQATLTGIPALNGLPRIDAGMGVSRFTRLGALATQHGYRTLFVQSSARDSFKIQGVARSAGFAEFYGKEDIPLLLDYPDPDLATFGWDYDTLMFLLGKLDGETQPFLAYVFTGTTHSPYPALEGHGVRAPHTLDGENGYVNALHYADWSLGEFMRAARQQPWFDNTVFILTADHVPRFHHGDFLSRFHIPCLIYGPGLIAPGSDDTIASQLDMLPTMVDLLGFPDEFAALGESLLRKEGGWAFVTEGGQAIGMITDGAYLRHNLRQRLEAVALQARLPEGELARVERRLLARDQLSFELLRDNRWAR